MSSTTNARWVHTVTFRLTVLYVALFAVLLVAVFVPLDNSIRSILLRRLDDRLVTKLSAISYYWQLFERKPDAAELIRDNFTWDAETEGREIVIWLLLSTQNVPVTTSDPNHWTPLDRLIAARPTVASDSYPPYGSTTTDPNGNMVTHYQSKDFRKLPIAAKTISMADKLDGIRLACMKYDNGMIAVVGYSLTNISRLVAEYRRVFVIAFLVMLILGSALGYLITRRAMGGVERITHTARNIGTTDLAKRVPLPHRGQEIDDLAAAFNAMLDRIQNLVNELKEVTTNVAHDLRSPITTIRGLAETTLAGRPSKEDFAATAGTVIAECDRLIGMIDAMLQIAELDSGLARVSDDPIDMNAVAGDAYALFLPVAEDKNVRLRFEGNTQSALVRGNLANLQRAVANLVDNAVKFTPSGADVSLLVEPHEHNVLLHVRDTGIGIAPETLPHIFDCFFRADPSRSTSGKGLGLSLAQSIVKAHGGDLTVQSTPGAGSTFTIELPRLQ